MSASRNLGFLVKVAATEGFIARYGLVKYKSGMGREYPREGVCEICGRLPVGKPYLLFDHCHMHGLTRGLICNWCNDQLGFLENGQIFRQAFNADFAPHLAEYRNNCPDCKVLNEALEGKRRAVEGARQEAAADPSEKDKA